MEETFYRLTGGGDGESASNGPTSNGPTSNGPTSNGTASPGNDRSPPSTPASAAEETA